MTRIKASTWRNELRQKMTETAMRLDIPGVFEEIEHYGVVVCIKRCQGGYRYAFGLNQRVTDRNMRMIDRVFETHYKAKNRIPTAPGVQFASNALYDGNFVWVVSGGKPEQFFEPE